MPNNTANASPLYTPGGGGDIRQFKTNLGQVPLLSVNV